jgi:outer membrane murein-binding lipoprotein Lpp
MEESQEMNKHEDKRDSSQSGLSRVLAIAAVAFLIVAGIAFGYRQQIMVGHLTAQQSVDKVTINDLQGQLATMTAKLNEMAADQQAAQAAAQRASQPGSKGTAVAGPATKRGPSIDKRYKQLQAQLEEQQKQMKETQDLVAKNRSDLEGNLNSTKDELNGSIARTHEELVALAKRGERSYFEFDLTKSKQFQRVGPISLSLRKADIKHKSYDVNLIVDDNDLSKKKVNLYEPIWIHVENEAQPVQIVVNRVEKNAVHGYVSAPKYKPSELAATGTANVTPVSAHPQEPNANQASPKQPE